MKSVKASPAQLAALECRMHGDEQVDGIVVRDGRVWFDDPDATFRALMDAANAEGDAAEYGHAGDDATFARRASWSLSALAGKVDRASR